MKDPCDRMVVTAGDGATVVACGHGGQVLGWTPAGGSADRLWTSPLARCGPGLAIRGGVPVIFPRFAARDLPGGADVPRHGFARDRAWTVEAGRDDEAAVVLATLIDEPATRALWPHRFSLRVLTTVAGDRLVMQVDVGNVGDGPFAFTLALHSYLRVSDPDGARVHGLAGRTGRDNADGRAVALPDAVPVLGPQDLAIDGVFAGSVDPDGPTGGGLLLRDPEYGPLQVRAEGFEDLVLWNPGAGHGLADVPADGASSFVCLEPARLAPVVLAPGGSWTGAQTLRSVGPAD